MSLFENPEYEWRETFFVLFDQSKRPTTERLRDSLKTMPGSFELAGESSESDGQLESVTVYCHDDAAAMDLSCVVGDEVREQVPELVEELRPNVSSDDERRQLRRILKSTGRLDVYHFGKRSAAADADDDLEDEFMDPGGALVLLELLAALCDGVVVDPQTGTIL